MLKEPLNHPVVWMEFGPVIALADAVALKTGALHDRALPRDVLDAHGASSHFTRAELITACRARSTRNSASTYPDDAFSRYGAKPELIAEVKAWALDWPTEIGSARIEAGLMPGWKLDRSQPDVLVWTTPSGRRYKSTLDGQPLA